MYMFSESKKQNCALKITGLWENQGKTDHSKSVQLT